MKTPTFLCLFALVLLSGCATTSTRTHPSLMQELMMVDSVVIIPPDVEITLITFTGENERLTEKENEIRGLLVENAKQRLTAKGFEVIDYDLQSEIENNEEFAYIVNQVKEGFAQAKKELKHGQQVSVEESRSVKASLGSAVNLVAEQSGADAVLLIRYEGFEKSDGQIAKDVGTSVLVGVLTLGAVVPVQATSGALTEVALIDGASGDVLWTDVKLGKLTSGETSPAMESMPMDVDRYEGTPAPQQTEASD